MGMRQSIRPTVAALSWLAAVACGAASAAQAADELPSFRSGFWELKRTVEDPGAQPMNVETRNCVDPSADIRRMQEAMSSRGCVYSPLAKDGNTYTLTADCKQGDATVRSRTVITAESDSAYSVTVTTISGERQSRETMTARRVGDCG
jgi:hypothetical protein